MPGASSEMQRCAGARFVPYCVDIRVVLDEQADNVKVTSPRCEMESSEALAVLKLYIAASTENERNGILFPTRSHGEVKRGAARRCASRKARAVVDQKLDEVGACARRGVMQR